MGFMIVEEVFKWIVVKVFLGGFMFNEVVE